MKREFLMLANKFELGKHNIGGWYLSAKLDGVRCFWDGGITTGLKCAEVPWANITKHDRFLTEQFATGLWTRYGQPIHAPSWWLALLPKMPLDGELYIGLKTWQTLVTIVKTQSVDNGWDKVRLVAFDSPPLLAVFRDGVINNANFKKTLAGCYDWTLGRRPEGFDSSAYGAEFFRVQKRFKSMSGSDSWRPLEQEELPMSYTAAESRVKYKLAEIEAQGGEGLMLRNPGSEWEPKRLSTLLKVKTSSDAEGTVVGYKFAKPTDMERSISGNQTDKLLGLMGSVRVRMKNGNEFDLSGFTDVERSFQSDAHFAYGVAHPGEEVPQWIEHPIFKRGDRITYKYRELSDDGLPKEARYLRKAVAL